MRVTSHICCNRLGKDSYAPNLSDWLIEESLRPPNVFAKLFGENLNLIIKQIEKFS